MSTTKATDTRHLHDWRLPQPEFRPPASPSRHPGVEKHLHSDRLTTGFDCSGRRADRERQ